MGDVKIHDVSYLPDPCPLPEQIKKRALIEKEKLIYAPFSGVGGIVYDKDAVYVELGGSHSHNTKINNADDETENIITNLTETKETLDAKLEHSVLQLFTGGEEITARDLNCDEADVASSNVTETYIKRNETGEQSELEKELNLLRNLGEEKISSEGRIRRKVIFETSDEEFSKNLNDDVSSDSESSDADEGQKERVLATPSKPKTTKYNEINAKVSGLLKTLEEKQLQKSEDESSESEEEKYEENSKNESDDDSSNESVESNIKKGTFSDSDSDEDETGVKWKENLTKKAEEAFFERQNSTQNLMKLVYGNKYNFCLITVGTQVHL